MKRPAVFFVLIAALAAGLMVLIAVAQIITQRNIERSRYWNKRTVLTFSFNNRLQGMVNLAFELETRMNSEEAAQLIRPGRRIKDSLNILGYNTTVLKQVWPDSADAGRLNALVSLINGQVNLSFEMLDAAAASDNTSVKKYADSLKRTPWNPRIYAAAVEFQKAAELKLEKTLEQSGNAYSNASGVSRLLAGVALLAIGLLATIIIRRQVKQLSLIKDLETTRKAAMESAKAKDQFLANMSHEIRTPLNAIKGFGKILLQTPLNADQHKYTTIISSASDNLLSIVNDILDFSKIESGNITLIRQPFSLHRQLTDIQHMFTPLAEEKSLKLLVTKNPDVPDHIRGDAQRLRQIFVNLISNAIKFTSEGRVQMHTSVIKDQPEKTTLLFQVSDTGIGIPREKLNMVFERFEQVDHSYSRQQGGTGLGLAITKWLAEAMGGKIVVKSEPGRGSVFSVEISFEKEPGAAPAGEMQEVQSDTVIDLHNKKILVAEDNKLNQLLVQNILDKQGVLSTFADNGDEAITFLTTRDADLVLMDIQMPGLDGFAATEIIRHRISKTIPIIAMTAHVLPGEKDKCIRAGMTDYISKPLDETELVGLIRKHIIMASVQRPVNDFFAEHDWLNMPYLKSICNGNAEKAKIILQELQKSLAGDTGQLENTTDAKDTAQLKKTLHSLKSTLSAVKKEAPPCLLLEQINLKLAAGAGAGEVASDIQTLISASAELRNKILLLLG